LSGIQGFFRQSLEIHYASTKTPGIWEDFDAISARYGWGDEYIRSLGYKRYRQIVSVINKANRELDKRQALTWYLQGAGQQGETFGDYLDRIGLGKPKPPPKTKAEIKEKTESILKRYRKNYVSIRDSRENLN
jgi:hypothetical protein